MLKGIFNRRSLGTVGKAGEKAREQAEGQRKAPTRKRFLVKH